MLAKLKGVTSEIKIIPTEPIGIEFSEATIVSVAPKEWVLEKIGIDMTKYAPVQDATVPTQELSVNEHIKGLKGREWQNMQRIIREFTKGKINREQASAMLKTGYALSDEEVNTWLGSEELDAQFAAQDFGVFFEFGEAKESYNIWKSKKRFSDEADFYMFADVTQLESDILDQIAKQKNITPEVLSEVLDEDVNNIKNILKDLEDRKILKVKETKIGKGINSNIEVSRELTQPLSKAVGETKPQTTEILVRYSYEWISGFNDSNKKTSRPFCVALLDANKLYSRSDIESMSARLGYSVWDRRGGWWNDNGVASESCRHEWKTNVVTRKK
jgi:hypothetical protein